MIFGCIFVEFSLVVFKFLRNNSNSEYCKKKNPCFSDLQYSVKESLKEKKTHSNISLFDRFSILLVILCTGERPPSYTLCVRPMCMFSPL